MDMLNPCIESMHDCNQVVVEMSELWEWNLIVSHSCDRPKPTGGNWGEPGNLLRYGSLVPGPVKRMKNLPAFSACNIRQQRLQNSLVSLRGTRRIHGLRVRCMPRFESEMRARRPATSQGLC